MMMIGSSLSLRSQEANDAIARNSALAKHSFVESFLNAFFFMSNCLFGSLLHKCTTSEKLASDKKKNPPYVEGHTAEIVWIHVFKSRFSSLFQYQFPIRTSMLTRSEDAL